MQCVNSNESRKPDHPFLLLPLPPPAQAWLIDSSLRTSQQPTPLPSTVYKVPFIGLALWLRDREAMRA